MNAPSVHALFYIIAVDFKRNISNTTNEESAICTFPFWETIFYAFAKAIGTTEKVDNKHSIPNYYYRLEIEDSSDRINSRLLKDEFGITDKIVQQIY